MNLKTLPNYSALRELFYRYHAIAGSGPMPDSSHVSSHWQIYGQASKAEIDREGNLVAVQGDGFGIYSHRRALRRLADHICCAIHFLRADGKRDIVGLAKVAHSLVQRIPFGHHYFSYDLFRQVHALATIRQYFHPHKRERFTIIAMGDGFGFFTALMKVIYPQATMVLVDLGHTLFFQCLYMQTLYQQSTHELIGEDHVDLNQAKNLTFSIAQQKDLSG